MIKNQERKKYNELMPSERWSLWVSKHPWYRHYNNSRERCKPHAKYGKRGIKFLMTIKDFEFLWHRDNASKMLKASIDRINNNGNYTLKNCRFIELSFNKSRRDGKSPWSIERRNRHSKRMLLAYSKRNKNVKRI